ncbi:hypothetical protein JZ751_021908 [Albula glossodonta]|uniref:Uncharacterized protein n=1 Tax=Albula glossodonta TaxID=121402 RepID=A0A8T2NHT3_9TELE|nr:hypothetical protein JZ751_021908 [Albula glossodonta]
MNGYCWGGGCGRLLEQHRSNDSFIGNILKAECTMTKKACTLLSLKPQAQGFIKPETLTRFRPGQYMKMKLWTVLEFIFLLSASGFFQCTDAQSTAVTTPDPTTALPVTNSKPPDTTPPPTQAPDSTTPEKTTEATPHPSCEDVDDWALCKDPKTLDCKGQFHCYCVNKEPFCRCDNYDGKFYIGDNCEQEWTILTFVLVATLPGVALATVVGVAVYLACNSKKKNPKGGKKR